MGYLGQGPKRFSEHNFIINGDLTLWQRGTSFTAFGGGGGTADAYTADRWKFVSAATDELDLDIARSATVPTYAQSGHTSQYSMFVDLDAAETAIAVDEYVGVRYALEGYEYQQMKGKWVTLSFWTRNALTGTYGVAFQTGDASKSFVREYTIDTADTWEKKALTFQLSEDATVEELNSGIGALIYFTLDAGANYQGTANQWNAADDRATSSQANWAGTVTNTFYITQVKLEIGQEATAFQRHGRSYQLELDAASRYYQKSFNIGTAPAQNVGVDTGEITFSALERTNSYYIQPGSRERAGTKRDKCR
jgi:hypothetical protein